MVYLEALDILKTVSAAAAAGAPAPRRSPVARNALIWRPRTSAYDVLARIRRGRIQFATPVQDAAFRGLVTMDTVFKWILPDTPQ